MKINIPYGSIFFSITMISFGIVHFMYLKNVATMVPAWFPDYIFWDILCWCCTCWFRCLYNFKYQAQCNFSVLLAAMIFLWFILLHVPSPVANPSFNRGNEVSSAFDALAFCGIKLVIVFGMRYQGFDKIN